MAQRQYSHLPQAEMHETRTRSPGRKAVTLGPVFSTVPTPSWPRMRPGAQVATSPLRMCKSVPQMVVFVIRTIASVAAAIAGIGRSSSAFLPGPRYTRAFIDSAPSTVASVALDAHRDAHPAADAKGRQAASGIALQHLVQKSH